MLRLKYTVLNRDSEPGIRSGPQILRLHGQFYIGSLPYMANELSSSERDLLSQHPEWADALATWTGRRLVLKSRWSCSRGTRLAPSKTSIQCLSLGKIWLHRYSNGVLSSVWV